MARGEPFPTVRGPNRGHSGVAVAKAVIVSEILIRRVPGLKQAVELGSNDVEEEYEPVDDAEKDHVGRRVSR